MTTSYNMIDRFLRQNLSDKDYPSHKEALDAMCEAMLQRTWVELTDVEIDYLLGSTVGENEETHISFARAIEAKLKEKNNG